MDPEQAETQAAVAEPLRRRTPTPEVESAGAERADPLAALASNVGNRNFTRTIARMRDGEGILPGGLVHPDVEAAIAAVSGRGRPLDRSVAESHGAALGDSFSDVRVHTDGHADALARAVSARAFTVGRDVFFAAGEYQPSTSDGQRLLRHELEHARQQKDAPAAGPLNVSQPGDPLERAAEAAAGEMR